MAQQYDIVLTDSGGDNNFMLKQEGQIKHWRVEDAPLLPQTLITESASPSHIQPEREIQISQVDWRKGIQDFLLEDSRKYYDSENCDARMKGQVILSPEKEAAISFPAIAPSITDGELEIWTTAGPPSGALTHWTGTGDTYYLSRSDDEYSGTYAAQGTGTSSTYKSGTIYQDITWDPRYRGRSFTVSVWGKTIWGSSFDYVTIGINDGVGSTTSGSVTKQTAYNQVSATRTLDDAATRLRVTISWGSYRNTVPATWDLVTLDAYDSALAGGTAHVIEFGDDIVIAQGGDLYSYDGSTMTPVFKFPKTITDLCVYQNRLYIAQGWADEYFYTSNLTTFTECTLASSTAKYMSNVGDSQFWISDSNNTMRDSDNPINGGTAFSTAYTIGSDAWDITGLVDHDETVFCRKEDDVYYLSVADVLSLLNLKAEASTTYTHGLYVWGDKLYIPSGVNSFYEYDIASGVATTISPTRYAPNDINYDGTVLAVTHDESYLYIAVDNGSDVKILAGRWEYVAGSTDWYWHPLYDFASNDIEAMLISSASGDKRLYAGTDTYTDGIYPFVVPISYSGIYLESGYTAEATGEFITPWFATNFPTEEKYWKSIDITSICITDKTSITPYYQIKGGAWTAMTVLTASALDGTDYPAETTDNREIDATSERIRFKFVFATTDTNYTPILYGSGGGFVVYANLLPDRSRQIVATIDLAPQIRLRDNSIAERQVDDDLTTLRGLYTANETITVTGPDGTTYSTIFARDGYTEQLAYEDETIRLEHWWIELKLLEV